MPLKKRNKRDYDIVIVGSGPAGLSAAVELSKHKGIKSLLIEKNDFLDVSTRSWSTFKSVLKKYNLLDAACYQLNHVRFRSLGGNGYTVHTGKDYLYVVNERKFKELLLKRVKINKMDKVEVKSFEHSHNRVLLNTTKGKIITKILIDASGNYGLCRKKFRIPVDTKVYFKCRLLEGCHFEGDTAPWGIILTKKKREEAFIAAWAEPYSNSKVLIATESYAHKKIPSGLHTQVLNKFVKDPEFRPIFKDSKIVREWNTEVPVTPLERVAYDNIIMVGDASCQTRPLMMEGLRPGMHEGEVAAKVVAKAIKQKNYSYKILKSYEDKIIHDLKFHENQELAKIFQLLFIYYNSKEFERFFSEVNKLDSKVLLDVLRAEVKFSDLPQIYQMIHRIVPVSELVLNLSKKDRHVFVQRLELYLEDEFKELINKVLF